MQKEISQLCFPQIIIFFIIIMCFMLIINIVVIMYYCHLHQHYYTEKVLSQLCFQQIINASFMRCIAKNLITLLLLFMSFLDYTMGCGVVCIARPVLKKRTNMAQMFCVKWN